MPGVVGYARTGRAGEAEVQVDDLARVPGLVASLAAVGVRLTKVSPHEPSLEELYLRVRHGERLSRNDPSRANPAR